MDWMTFTSNLLKFVSDLAGSLAWPAVAVWLAWRFRTEIRPLINKLTSLKLGSVEAKFALDTEKALGDIQATPEPQPPRAPAQAGTKQGRTDEEIRFSIADPPTDSRPASLGLADAAIRNSLLVARAWNDVEWSIDKLAKELGSRITYDKANTASNLSGIARIGVLEPRFVQALRSLQELRNEVIHTPKFEPTDESTRGYLEAVRSARSVLKEATLAVRSGAPQ